MGNVGMEDTVDQEGNAGSISGPLILGTKPRKRLTSKVWDDFIPTFANGKLARAECMHCHRIFNCSGYSGTTILWNHQARCNPGTRKRPKLHEHTSLPSTQKGAAAASFGSDPKQQKPPSMLSSQMKGPDTTDVMPGLEVPDTPADTNRRNEEVDQNGSHEALAAPGQKNVALAVISTDNNREKNEGAEQNISCEELVRILAMHGHVTRMVEQDDFRKLVAHLNPEVKVPSNFNLRMKTFDLFNEEKSKLKEKLTALPCRVCLSAHIWQYDPLLVFLCLTVHYIDDEWVKQKNIIGFSPVDPSCSTEELSYTILRAIKDWGLDEKVFSIILDDDFIDESVASNVKTSLQKRNKVAANKSLFVARFATHLLDEIIQVGLDELDTIVEKSAKCSRYKMDHPSLAYYPKCRYAPSVETWKKAKKICDILEKFHRYKDFMHKSPRPDCLFDKVWNVKKEVHRDMDNDRFKPEWQVLLQYKEEEVVSIMRQNMENKFKELWKVCFLHFCMPMVMNPEYRLECIKSRIQDFSLETWYSVDTDIDEYICEVHDTLLNLYSEYSSQVQGSDCSSRSQISMGDCIGRDVLHELYLHTEYPFGKQPLTELDHYLQEARLAKGESSVLRWWKEHNATYPTIGRMARDILALPFCTECSAATRTARTIMSESGNRSRVEKLVCIQDWLASVGTASVESTNDVRI